MCDKGRLIETKEQDVTAVFSTIRYDVHIV